MAVQFVFGVAVPLTTPKPKPAPQADNRKWSLYVGDLDPQVTEADLIDKFRLRGPIASMRLCCDSFTGDSLCYAYVNFFTSLDASTALTFLNHKELKGKSIRIMWSQLYPLTRKTGIGNLFVKNLHPSITSAQLQSMFSKFGRILSCKVAAENGKTKGFGLVQYDSEQSSMTARNARHGTLVKGQKILYSRFNLLLRYVSKFIKKSARTGAHGEAMRASLQGKHVSIFSDKTNQNMDQGKTKIYLYQGLSGRRLPIAILKS